MNEEHPNEAKLNQLTEQIRHRSIPSTTVEQIKREILASTSLKQSVTKQTSPSTRNWIAIASLAACAVVLFSIFPLAQPNAFAQMQLRLAEIKTVQVSKSSFGKGEAEPYHSANYLIAEPLHFRMEEEGLRKRISVIDVASFRAMNIWPEVKKCILHPIYDTKDFLRSRNEFLDLLRFANAKDAKKIGTVTAEGRKLIEYEITVFNHIDEETSIASVFIDPKTQLPTKIVEVHSNEDTTVFENFVFDEHLDASLFEMKAPKGYEVKRIPTLDDIDLTLDASKGLGEASFGMNKEEVAEAIGQCDVIAPFGYWSGNEPDKDEPRLELFYSRGFRIAICPEHGAFQFSCSNQKEARPFQGLTTKGIRRGASRESIKDAYGSNYEVMADGSWQYKVSPDTTLQFRFGEDSLDEMVLTRELPQ